MSGLSDAWERWGAGFEEALRHGGGAYALRDVREMVDDGRAQFWPSERGCVVTVVHDYPQRRILRVWLATGEWEAFDRAAGIADQIARNLGCDGVEIEGRKGWARKLAKHGYRMERVILTKDV